MAAPKGNEYYLLRSKDGRDKKFETPEELTDSINEYFQWAIENPLKESQLVSYQGESKLEEIPKMRAFSLEGLCNFIDLSVDGFKLYEKREDFIGVTTRARQIIDSQQFEGAASNFLNPNIIARKLGLSDKKEVDYTGDVNIKPAEWVSPPKQ